jgi:hypothetical protein
MRWLVCSIPCVATIARRLELNDILETANHVTDEGTDHSCDWMSEKVDAPRGGVQGDPKPTPVKKAAVKKVAPRKAPAKRAAV